MSAVPDSREILRDLVAFATISRQPNLDLIDYIAHQLAHVGADIKRVGSKDGTRSNLFTTIGPTDRAGVMLSGHTDVVPITGQAWTVPPFDLTDRDGRLYGRGTTDMKGFVACALSAALRAAKRQLAVPLHLAFSYDEEIGCIGVRRMIDMMRDAPFQPILAIIGEPTELKVASGHKGKVAAKAICRGREGHSALARRALNAIHLASDFIQGLRAEQTTIAEHGSKDADYDIAYTTLHVGQITGGTALNIVPNRCELDFEIRYLAEDDPVQIMDRLRHRAQMIVAATDDCDAAIEIEIINDYPGLATPVDSQAIRFVQSLTGANTTCKVAFGTEGGLFNERLGIASVVCGPGSMAQGHKPDEFITLDQLQRCDAMLDQLIEHLVAGF